MQLAKLRLLVSERPSILQSGVGYHYAAADTAAANSGSPWNLVAAVANDAVNYLGARTQDAGAAWYGILMLSL